MSNVKQEKLPDLMARIKSRKIRKTMGILTTAMRVG